MSQFQRGDVDASRACRFFRRCFSLAVVLCVALTVSTLAQSKSEESAPKVRYGRDIRPILSDRCFVCHGADEGSRQVGLRLDLREEALSGFEPAIVPGDVPESLIWKRITSEDPRFQMPPPEAKKPPVSEEERELLRRWIEEGAEYEEHWAFVAPVKSAEPEVRADGWPRDEIDQFVLAGIEAAGLEPSPETDRAALLRRLFLDLTGLPPSVEELDLFLTDSAPEAYELWVDRLLAEEPYRSRMAEHLSSSWLDAARYADTIGIHTDNGKQMWLWRDWVIDAFANNMPYDQFVTEQLAGDLLPNATVEQRIASGFNRNHVSTDEGGAIPEEYLVEYAVDRASTTGTVFLGLTMGCARCHDHKYDPITQKDFYAFTSFFNSIEEPGLYSQTPNVIRAYEPFLEVPTPEQNAALTKIGERHAQVQALLEQPLPEEDGRFEEFLKAARREAGVEWTTPKVLSAHSTDSAVALEVQENSSILATGSLPDFEDYVIELEAIGGDLQLLLLEAFTTPNPDADSTVPDGAGRASHGNAVVSHATLEARPKGLPAEWQKVSLNWAWADHTQQNGDFEAGNVLEADERGWALDGNENAGPRTLMVLAEEKFGFAAGTELRVTLSFRSRYAQHSLGHVRLSVSGLADRSRLPAMFGRWYHSGPFGVPDGHRGRARSYIYEQAFGPESVQRIDLAQKFGDQSWSFRENLIDGAPVALESGLGVIFLGRTVWSPDARKLRVHLGSDDGFALYVRGEELAARRVDRGVAKDQDEVEISLVPGPNALVLKVVNTGGQSGYAFRPEEEERVLVGELPTALIPDEQVAENQKPEFKIDWRRRFFGAWRALDDERSVLEAERAEIRAAVPRTMVMKELSQPRDTFVLSRGQYDAPDKTQPVGRTSPHFLNAFPEEATPDRLGLAVWLTAPDNSLFARVAVNRFWQQVFGEGLVRTPQDFGYQGAWPTHPELLDTLAVEFRESGYDVHALLRRLVTSSTYRQSSKLREDGRDPSNRLLARYPRRRLSAEQIRDLALGASGLLIESTGGPPVKPYQPPGLWQEVAMLASNTRFFERGMGDDLYRRSLYTYWKRAIPPPSLQAFDAPTRESCVVRRQATNTPLQALVTWNDEQFVEAARVLAERALELEGKDLERIEWMFRTCTARRPRAPELGSLLKFLSATRDRFVSQPEDAAELLLVGESRAPAEISIHELAAWTLLASSVLNLHETLTQD